MDAAGGVAAEAKKALSTTYYLHNEGRGPKFSRLERTVRVKSGDFDSWFEENHEDYTGSDPVVAEPPQKLQPRTPTHSEESIPRRQCIDSGGTRVSSLHARPLIRGPQMVARFT